MSMTDKPTEESRLPDGSIESNEADVRKVDEALKFLRREAERGEEQSVDEEKLVKKIDLMIVPLMFVTYTLQYLDKTLLNYASVTGLLEDAALDTSEFANLSLFFYLSYLCFELPHAYVMQRLPTGKYLGAMVICLGIVVACTSACGNYGSLVAVRFLLGLFKSAVAPALILITSMWYKRSEQPLRVGFWYVGVGVAVMFGSLNSFGFQHYHGQIFASWQVLFLVIGVLTVIHGVILVLFLLDNPMSSRLIHLEKVLAVERLRENKTGVENKDFKPYQALECIKDPQTYLIVVLITANNVPSGAISTFQSILISSLGSPMNRQLCSRFHLGLSIWFHASFFTWVADRYDCRGVSIAIVTATTGILGGALLAFLPGPTNPGKLVGVYLNQAFAAFLPLTYSLSAANYAGHTKKVTMNALLLMDFCAGNMNGPKTFMNGEAPTYPSAKIAIVASTSVALVTTVVLLRYYRWENRRRDRDLQQTGSVRVRDEDLLDLTDRENKEFRYRL